MKEQEIQESQYQFPYHYLPRADGDSFLQHAYWSWGYRYLGGMLVTRELCAQEPYASLLDLGCGDGRFISELAREKAGHRLMGIDYSERAIALARAMNAGVDYRAANILADDIDVEPFDVVTLVEVIEHIPPDELDQFIERAVAFLKPGGRLVLTVPHNNNPVGDKHFQHFDSEMLTRLLSPHLDSLEFHPFDYFSRPLDLWFRLIGRTGKYFVITWPPILNAFYRYYVNRCLRGNDESRCGRIACVARKPAS